MRHVCVTLFAHTAPEVEETVRIRRSVGGRPYYITRHSVTEGSADAIMVLHEGVFHATTRKLLDLNIKSYIVVDLDEAQIVTGYVRELHSCSVCKCMSL